MARAILARLIAGEASVTELAEHFEMNMPAISKYLKVLERAGLIHARAQRPVAALFAPGGSAQGGQGGQGGRRLGRALRCFWEESFDRLEEYLHALQEPGQETGP